MEKYHRTDVAPIERENERDENYQAKNPQIDSERTNQNYRLWEQPYSYTEYINQRIESLHLPTKPRKDAVVMNSFVIGSDREFFKDMPLDEQKQFFRDCTFFFADKYGQRNILSAVVHMDETTPHLHLNLMPITEDGRLCSKELFDKGKLSALQTEFHEKVGKKYGLQHGKEGSQEKHLSTAEYKAKKIIEQAERETEGYKLALQQAENGEFSKRKGKLKEQVVAAIAETTQLKKENILLRKDQKDLFERMRKLEEENKRLSPYKQIVDKLRRENGREFERLLNGGPRPTMLGGFFSSVLSLFTPQILARSNRLQEIQKEIEEEQKKYEKQNGNYKD